MAEFDKTGRSSWSSDLAEIPERYGVSNVYGDLGQLFAWTAGRAAPRRGIDGEHVKGLAPTTCSGYRCSMDRGPQWQIEGLRRLEIPEDMQQKYGFKPLGPADGLIKNGILPKTQCASTISTSGPTRPARPLWPKSRPIMYRTDRAAQSAVRATFAMR